MVQQRVPGLRHHCISILNPVPVGFEDGFLRKRFVMDLGHYVKVDAGERAQELAWCRRFSRERPTGALAQTRHHVPAPTPSVFLCATLRTWVKNGRKGAKTQILGQIAPNSSGLVALRPLILAGALLRIKKRTEAKRHCFMEGPAEFQVHEVDGNVVRAGRLRLQRAIGFWDRLHRG